MAYEKQEWKDHFVGPSGEVLQQGTPMDAEHFNHIEQGVFDANDTANENKQKLEDFEKEKKELVRKAGAGLKETYADEGKTIKQIEHSNSVDPKDVQGSNGTIEFGAEIEIPSFKYDKEGHITESGTTKAKLPDNVPIKNIAAGLVVAGGNISVERDAETGAYTISATGGVSISSAEVTIQESSFTYDGEEKTKVVESVVLNGKPLQQDLDYVVTGNKEKNAGTHTLVISGIGTYTGAITRQWSIAKAQYDMKDVSLNPASVVYDGQPHSLTITGKPPAGVAVSYSGGGTTVGQYQVTATFNGDTVNYEPISSLTATLTITKATVQEPTASGSLTYNGSLQSPNWNGYNSSVMTIGGVSSASDAGSYDATFTLRDTQNYQWSDKSVDVKTVSWSIAKAVGTISVSPSELTLSGAAGTTGTATVTANGNGTITAVSRSPGIAQASFADNKVKVTSVSSGNAIIDVKITGSKNHTDASCTLSVDVSTISATLNDNSWKAIADAAANGTASSIWSVGATKSVKLKGTVGTLAIDTTLWVYILGFDHNATYEGNKKIHFGCFKTAQTGGTSVCLVDSGYGSYYTDGKKYFNMNHWGDYNYGGWSACDIRYDVLGSTDTKPDSYGSKKTSGVKGHDPTATCATSPVAGTLLSCFEEDLRAVMCPVTKYSDNVAGGSGSVQANVTKTTDYLWLLSEYEVFGKRSYANTYEESYQKQYDYYKNGNSPKMFKHNDTATAAVVRLRSAYFPSSHTFCILYSDGTALNSSAASDRGLAPAFAVSSNH